MLSPYCFVSEGEAGCDEAGRGCLAGAVFAAAVVFPRNYENPDLNDSKQLSEKKRYQLREQIEQQALSFAVARVDPEEIDRINILNASILAMHRALDGLKIRPSGIIVDGNRFKPYQDIAYRCVVKGDARYMSIAAASILAKTYRDDYMLELHREYPCYGWDKNKAYPTSQHYKAILENGISPYHRKSFRLKPEPTLF